MKTKGKKKQSIDGSSSSTISTSAIHHIIEKLKGERVKNSTRKIYYAVWRNFNNFFIRLDEKPDMWEDRIVLYVAYLIHEEKCSQTIKSYISALKAVLKDDGVILNEDKFLLAALTKACKYKNDRATRRLPIQKGMLRMILSELDKMFDEKQQQPYLHCMYKTLFTTAYFGLFRIGELATGSHPVMVQDVFIANNKKKFKFILRTSKTHGLYSKPQSVKISSTSLQNYTKDNTCDIEMDCPYKLLNDYVMIRPPYQDPKEPFFVMQDYGEIKPEVVRKTLKLAIKNAGFDDNYYNFHSFRAGRTVDLRKNGLKIDDLKELGRWSSSSVYTYLKQI